MMNEDFIFRTRQEADRCPDQKGEEYIEQNKRAWEFTLVAIKDESHTITSS